MRQDGVWHARMVALFCWPFELPPLNELYMGKLVRSGMANSVNPDLQEQSDLGLHYLPSGYEMTFSYFSLKAIKSE